MRSVPRPARFLIVAAACSLLYGLGDILTCALVDSKDPGTSWQALSCLAAFVFAVVCAGSLTPLLALLDRRHEQRSREALARKLDYSAIAAMERPIWGEAFEHEGAPKTGGIAIPAGSVITSNTAHAERKRSVRYVKPVKAPEPVKCYCNWCRGRRGVHGWEAKALYQAEISALKARYSHGHDKTQRRESGTHPDTTQPATTEQSAISLIGEFRPNLGGFKVYHVDGDALNNDPSNLELRERPS